MTAGGALFGSSATGPGSTGGNKHLVEMRAGKMYMKGRTVYPDKRKGLLYVYQSEDSLMHFCWQDRTSGVVEDDLIIFPDDCEYQKVPQCTTGRVYLLKFKSSSRRFFFWLQEPSADKDDDNCKRINDYLNNPSGTVPSASSPDQDLQSLLNNMSQSQLVQLFGGGVGQGGLHSLLGTISGRSGATPALTHRPITSTANTPATTAPTALQSTAPAATTGNVPKTTERGSARTTAAAPSVAVTSSSSAPPSTNQSGTSSSQIKLSDLQNLLQDLAHAPPRQAAAEQQSVDLSTALNADALSGLMGNAEVLEQLQGHLPPVGEDTQETLRSTLASPQFQQAVSQFSTALESGQLGPVVSQLAVNPDAVNAASKGSMQDFIKALEKNPEKSGESSGGSRKSDDKGKTLKKEDEKKDDEEEMQLD